MRWRVGRAVGMDAIYSNKSKLIRMLSSSACGEATRGRRGILIINSSHSHARWCHSSAPTEYKRNLDSGQAVGPSGLPWSQYDELARPSGFLFSCRSITRPPADNRRITLDQQAPAQRHAPLPRTRFKQYTKKRRGTNKCYGAHPHQKPRYFFLF